MTANKTKSTVKKKRNRQDATLTNINALKKRVDSLEHEVSLLRLVFKELVRFIKKVKIAK